MLFLLVAVVVLLFPLGAVEAWRRQTGRGLALLTAIGVGAIVMLALVSASELGGNRLVSSRGYAYTAARGLALAGVVFVAPMLGSAATVWVTAHRFPPRVVYLIAVAIALAGTVVGTLVASVVMSS